MIHTLRQRAHITFTINDKSSIYSIVVETGAGSLCYTAKAINISGPSGYLSSVITAGSGFGTDSCPWVIRVDPGQRINITLLDFSLATTKDSDHNQVITFIVKFQVSWPHKPGILYRISFK